MSAMRFKDVWYNSDDGLRLYARDYPNADAELTLLCMHGLTRNSADFEDLAAELADQYRVVVVDQRGRGRSDWDSVVTNYNPARYVQDMQVLIEYLDLKNVVLVGTSMGGLMSMMMVAMQPAGFSAVVMNDIGPVVNPAGLERIKGYVGKGGPVETWEDAVVQTRSANEVAFPDYTTTDWQRWVKRMYQETPAGELQLLYDPAISEPLNSDEAETAAVPPDLWPLFDAMINLPLMVVRGERSDILTSDCLAEMKRRHPDTQIFEVTNVGHAPMLDEPGVVSALRNFLTTA